MLLNIDLERAESRHQRSNLFATVVAPLYTESL